MGTAIHYPLGFASQVVDHDPDFGQFVEAGSQSTFWAETCRFAIEDAPQAGWDPVSSYRATCYVLRPYTHRNKSVPTQYNHTSILRTLKLILSLPPMNQLDATAAVPHPRTHEAHEVRGRQQVAEIRSLVLGQVFPNRTKSVR